MRKQKPIINYMDASHQFLIELGYLIVLCMTGNLFFPNPDPAMDALNDLVKDFETKLTKAAKGGPQEQAEMIAARELLLDALRSIGLYVDQKSNGDTVKLRSSGFLLSKDPIPSQKDTFYLLHGKNPDDIYVVQKAVDKATAYVTMYFVGDNPPEDETLWKLGIVNSKHRAMLSGMQKMEKIWVRCCSVLRKDGMQAWTQPLYIVLG